MFKVQLNKYDKFSCYRNILIIFISKITVGEKVKPIYTPAHERLVLGSDQNSSILRHSHL